MTNWYKSLFLRISTLCSYIKAIAFSLSCKRTRAQKMNNFITSLSAKQMSLLFFSFASQNVLINVIFTGIYSITESSHFVFYPQNDFSVSPLFASFFFEILFSPFPRMRPYETDTRFAWFSFHFYWDVWLLIRLSNLRHTL